MNDETKTFSDYLAILKRRRTVLLLTFIAIFLPGVYITYSIEPIYRSTATFLIEQQSIHRDFAQTTVTGYTDERIQETRQRVMSRSNLEALVLKHGLYSDLGEDSLSVIDRMEENTLFEPQVAEVVNERTGRSMLATITFEVSFDYHDPQTAQAVAADLADLYVQENEGNRLDQVRATVEFLESDLARLKGNVDTTAEALSNFRQLHAGNLPEQTNFNMMAIERIERQIGQLEEDMRRARDRKTILEGELLQINPIATVFDEHGEPIRGTAERLSELQRERLRLLSLYSPEHPDVININKQIESLSGAAPGSAYVVDIDVQLAAARAALHDARQRYSDSHPDVIQKARSVSALEKQLADAESQNRPYSSQISRNPAVQQVQEQIRAVDMDLRTFSQKRFELMQEIDELEAGMARLPKIEVEFETLSREAESAIARYDAAVNKLDEAKVAERLETRGSGDRIALIGIPVVPSSPYEPNRTAILMLVIVLGAGIGVILATVIDTLDDTVKSPKDIMLLSNTPAMAVIPFLETTGDQRKRISKNISLTALSVLTIIAAIIMSMTVG